MVAGGERIVEREVAYAFLALVAAAVGLAVAPDKGGVVVGVAYSVVGLRCKAIEHQSFGQFG